MHPEFMRALAHEHQREILGQREFRHNGAPATAPSPAREREPRQRLRQSLGTALVSAGSRLMGGNPVVVELFDGRK